MQRLPMVPAVLLVAALGACDTGLLDILPQDEIAQEIAIVDQETAQAAVNGAYSSFQSGSLLGGDYVMWTDLLSDDVEHTGTFGSYGQGDLINIPADNGVVSGIWDATYDGILRVNTVIKKVPEVDDIPVDAVDGMLGQMYALRALHYFHLVRAYGGVVLVTEPAENLADIEELAQATRSSAAEVWTRIEADLAQATSLLGSAGIDNSDRNFVTPGFVDALEAKAHLYQRDWAAAEAAALEVVNSGDYALAADYASLFGPDGSSTSATEDIFRLVFTATDPNNYGYYYQFAGRFEIGATQDIYDAYDQANDERFDVNFDQIRPDGIEVVKYPTTSGTEDFHVMRYAEVLLILAEALAQQGGVADLTSAVTYLNMVHTRAGLTTYVYGVDLITQQDVLDAIYLERRLELAFEGERWFDLVRTDRAAAVLGSAFSPHEALLPLPQGELDVSENLVQNPGY
ncbi:MAG TPA: RagB/SusD family nutrient uptake outer membrane protein [Longimicrobiales bacterium]|nr:RagB/SusD family nutrient uptake outer membrane protein [Longimicrobiales bacterium]